MSEIINNSQRQEKLKNLIKRLHQGEDRTQIEIEFKRDFASVTGAEIAQMESKLVEEGVSIDEIQSLCDVHASLFQGSVVDLHQDVLTVNPMTEFETENEDFQKMIDIAESTIKSSLSNDQLITFIKETAASLKEVDAHYAKKENILFPILEKNGNTTVPQVMWGVDNKIRDAIRLLNQQLVQNTSLELIVETYKSTLTMIKDMIIKENNILFPMLKDLMTQEDFKLVAVSLQDQSGQNSIYSHTTDDLTVSEKIQMSAGQLSPTEINALFNTLPFDMTFVGADQKVKFVSQGKERIFDRPLSVIGRPIQLCHPPQSVHIVMKIVEDLESGKKDHEDFWIQFRGKFVLIRYYAVRDEQGTYLGCLEVTQDIKDIQNISGEKRLAD
ncbi:MAG: hypothetical protein FD133_634 [Erysipelotrichaceae bacterium]|nr:MAG: hypothetical protein FD179_1251 [Erysipelotrichaceae bacterium]TXT18880.1 MAG: hypothetical protein FD133_634 [Erysipelotrichaceae bacterium]